MFIYFFLLRIVSLFNPKARKLVKGQARTIEQLSQLRRPGERWVWFHAASVGEFEQGRMLIERLRQQQPEVKILLTFFSPSGYELRKDYPLVDMVAYLPFATPLRAKRFLNILQPEKAIFIKYEYWPAYLRALKKRDIPTYIVCAIFRPTQSFFRWWGMPYRSLLGKFTRLFVQDDSSRELLAKYGIDNVSVAGDTRFDRVHQVYLKTEPHPLVEYFAQQSKKVVVAGSTWPRDEALLIRYLRENPEVRLVLVPHELTEQHLSELFQRLSGRYVLLSEASKNNLTDTQCLVVDRVGLLSSLYHYATVSYVGGGFGVGIHNTLEAAVYYSPVVFGPNCRKFREAERLQQTGGGFVIHNYAELAACLDRLLDNPAEAGKAAGDYVESELGATDKIFGQIFQ